MNQINRLRTRIIQLASDVEKRDSEIRELKAKRREALDLVDEMREHLQDGHDLIDSWIEVFEMQQDAAGVWQFDVHHVYLIEQYNKLHGEHEKLIREWNKFVGRWNRGVAPRERGRPLEASDVQVKEVRRMRQCGASLRAIAKHTGLGVRTVRTIVEKDAGIDRTSKRTNLLRKREFDRRRAADWRARKRLFDALPKRVTAFEKRGKALHRAAKDLGE